MAGAKRGKYLGAGSHSPPHLPREVPGFAGSGLYGFTDASIGVKPRSGRGAGLLWASDLGDRRVVE